MENKFEGPPRTPEEDITRNTEAAGPTLPPHGDAFANSESAPQPQSSPTTEGPVEGDDLEGPQTIEVRGIPYGGAPDGHKLTIHTTKRNPLWELGII